MENSGFDQVTFQAIHFAAGGIQSIEYTEPVPATPRVAPTEGSIMCASRKYFQRLSWSYAAALAVSTCPAWGADETPLAAAKPAADTKPAQAEKPVDRKNPLDQAIEKHPKDPQAYINRGLAQDQGRPAAGRSR